MTDLCELYKKVVAQFNKTQTLVSCSEIISEYTGDDWKKYVEFSDTTYKRNILHEFSNDDIEMILICWNDDQISQIHDHPSSGCLVRILEGILTEDFYERTDLFDNTFYKYISSRENNIGDISYMEKNQTVHRVRNTNIGKSISLHIYSPPKFKHSVCKVEKADSIITTHV